jgi:hypothetical protein
MRRYVLPFIFSILAFLGEDFCVWSRDDCILTFFLQVIVRCGDSPLNADHRPSDGLFSMEVTKDEEAQTATFHLKSVFVDTTEGGKGSEPLPWRFQFAHRLYTKLWMETATRKLLK